jgi:transcriptional antiterminator RfaH
MATINMESVQMKNWYTVFTKPKKERTALNNLERQGYACYLPFIRIRRRPRSYIPRVEPMFPRYLFIQLDKQNDNWSSIRSTFGVSNLVRFGEYPAVVPESLIEALKRNESDGAYEPPLPVIKRGDSVRITDGVLAGYEGIFEATSSRDRVILLLKITGQYARVQTHIDQIELAV